eukprot:TRINITY_DN14701_c0_g1_i1.p1 TRINITY_DN14701_c0_g1~~TRINITY_DN14701_c0_g1_i1.p1  ORF type:complete len:222 (-),score=53.64 TRINITY_DN14701_c0_g1_i1:73-738(-)
MAAANRAKDKDFDLFVKMILIGDSGVGKSCLLLRFSDDSFTPTFISTIGVDFKVKMLEIDGKKVKIQVVDTAGQERFRTITANYYRGAQGVMMVYDITDTKSFENINHWLKNVRENAPPSAIKILVGNKSDLNDQREVSFANGEALAREAGIKFLETSAKDRSNVEEAFLTLAKDILAQQQQPAAAPSSEKDKPSEPPKASTVTVTATPSPAQQDKGKCCG